MQFGKFVKEFLRHTIGTSANNDAINFFYCESFAIQIHYHVNISMRVGVGLEVGEITHVGVFLPEKMFPLFELLCDRLRRGTIGGIKRLIIAISATTTTF